MYIGMMGVVWGMPTQAWPHAWVAENMARALRSMHAPLREPRLPMPQPTHPTAPGPSHHFTTINATAFKRHAPAALQAAPPPSHEPHRTLQAHLQLH